MTLRNNKLVKSGRSKVTVSINGKNKVEKKDEFDNEDKIGDNKVSNNKVAKKKSY